MDPSRGAASATSHNNIFKLHDATFESIVRIAAEGWSSERGLSGVQHLLRHAQEEEEVITPSARACPSHHWLRR